ncbi:hypothetical protein M758_8G028100 [Ceratodon purpureus]|uniref:Uncharacterized protein n=1 Tax=Ceratodon purpureus TaxID=3225 RepID=A0A8T0GZ60_CERPU|nr:hypothetical protein KC19_8G029200 [Ceratodon purpureus]KAG0607434.1 hypothetical protein M758_8G028100 [Ceratodon purpureus]
MCSMEELVFLPGSLQICPTAVSGSQLSTICSSSSGRMAYEYLFCSRNPGVGVPVRRWNWPNDKTMPLDCEPFRDDKVSINSRRTSEKFNPLPLSRRQMH